MSTLGTNGYRALGNPQQIPSALRGRLYANGQSASEIYPQILGADGQPYRKTIGTPGLALPQPWMSAGLINVSSKTWSWRWDEAYKESRENALAMRRDVFLMSLLRERMYPTEQMSWHVEPEDKNDPYMQEEAANITATIQAIPRLRRLFRSTLEALWYGRAGAQVRWNQRPVRGQLVWTIDYHTPVNGDKIQYGWDGTPRILIYGGAQMDLKNQGAEIILTDRQVAIGLSTPFWRDRFILHKHDCIDADFFEPEMQGGLHGVGIRHWCYWFDWQKKEVQSWLMDYMERTGLGLTIYPYYSGNPASEAQARKSAKQDGRNTVIVWPMFSDMAGETIMPQRIETSTQGAEVIQAMMEYFDSKIERFIIGQSMSGGADHEDGLGGTGRSNLAADTKYRIIRDDAENLAETMTEDLVSPLQRFNNWNLCKYKFKFDVDSPDPEAKLGAAKTIAVDMKIPIKQEEVLALGGFSKPGPGDAVTEIQEDKPALPPGAKDEDDGEPWGTEDEKDNFSQADKQDYQLTRLLLEELLSRVNDEEEEPNEEETDEEEDEEQEEEEDETPSRLRTKGSIQEDSDVDEDLWLECREILPDDEEFSRDRDGLPFFCGKIDNGVEVYLIDGNRCKVEYDADYSEGGNGLEDPDLCGKTQIVLDADHAMSDLPFVLYHEAFERRKMLKGQEYGDAHVEANAQEMFLRKRAYKKEKE